MADAQVLTPEQIQQILAAQQQQSASTSTSSSSTNAPAQPSNRLKSSFRKRRSFEPFYTGGATAITPDGSTLFATLNEQVTVVDVSSGSIVQRIEGDTEEITALAVTPSGSHLVVASRSLALSVYALPECNLIRTMAKTHTSQVNLMSVDPTGTLLATGGADGVAKVWDLQGGFCTHVFKGHAGVVSALAWNLPPSPPAAPNTGKKSKKASARVIQLLTGSVDGKVRVWDLNNQAEVHKPAAVLAGHDSVVRGIAITLDGNTVITGSRDRTLVIWKLSAAAGWKQAETLSANEGIESVGFISPSVFFTGGSSGTLRLWSLSTSSIIAVEPRTFNQRISPSNDDEEIRAITHVHLLSATSTLVSVHADQNLVFRSVVDESLRKVRQMVGFNDEIVDLALTCAQQGGEETHLAVATNSRSLRMYSLGNEEQRGTTVELLPGHEDIVLCLDRSPDARLLASGAKDRCVRIWAFVSASRLAAVGVADDDAGKKVSRAAATGTEQDGAGEWVCVAICTGHAESVGAVAFARRPCAPGAPFAPFIVTASQDRTVKVWDLSPVNALLSTTKPLGQPIQLKSLTTQRVHEKDINCLDVSPNNSMLATGSQDRTAKIFTLSFTPRSSTSSASARLTTLATLKGHKRGIWACRFSPTDLALATASGDKSIRLWSLRDFSSVKLFQGHTNSVLKLCFLSSGMQLLSCAADGLVKLWNIKDEECATTVDAHDDKVWSVAVEKREGWFVSAAADGTVGVWEDSTEEEEERKREEREKQVEMEQEFGNMLTKKDWRNAISLALQMGQPRRLLALFRVVQESRPEATGRARGLLDDVLAGEDSDDEVELEPVDGEGVNGRLHRRGGAARNATAAAAASAAATDADATSITGLHSVDEIIATLSPAHLIQLLLYIRDWNTSTRTSAIAQTLLHAILSFHTASSLISIFASSLDSHRTALAERLENQQLGIVATLSDKQRAQQKRAERENNVDLATLVEALLPYTERHWLRADRTLVEASMLEYSVEAMDTLLGAGEGREEKEEGGERAQTFGEQIDEDDEQDVEMDGQTSD